MAHIELRKLRKAFGGHEVIRDVNLMVEPGEFMVFVGPSGCGKSTLLRLIAGLEDISGGDLLFDGVRVNNLVPSRRGIAMVFQSYALYPHMTVFDNMAFGLRLAKSSSETVAEKVTRAAKMLQIEPLLGRYPRELSGGQRQRVAIGRAITRDPRVFLFDEPLSNLDAALRVQTRIEIARLHRAMARVTMVYVTHDQVEAMTMADRICVLRDGRIEQVGTPVDLYERPENLFVATFIGSPQMNVLKGPAAAACGAAAIGLRPEHLALDAGEARWRGRVVHVEELGADHLAYVDLDIGGTLTVRMPGRSRLALGTELGLGCAPAHIYRFDEAGKRLV
jgi:multiple sugar transport system ATP-binding protein